MRVMLFNLPLLYAADISLCYVINRLIWQANTTSSSLIEMRSYSKYIIRYIYLFDCRYNELKSPILL